MVKYNEQGLDGVFQALADPTRRAMLAQLATGQATIGELAAPFEMSLPGASKHVRILEKAGLVRREREGRRHICRMEAAPLKQAQDWIAAYSRFWNARLDALEDILRAEDHDGESDGS